jgi:hypothetical protein
MANPIEYSRGGTTRATNNTSRYSSSKVIYYGTDRKLAYAIYKRKKIAFQSDDKYYEIAKEVEFRPDLVSYAIYGIPDYWWKIMEMNGMKDILEFRAGRNIRLPGGTIML